MRYILSLLLLIGAVWFFAYDSHILAKSNISPSVDVQAQPPLGIRKPTFTPTPTATGTPTDSAITIPQTPTKTPTSTPALAGSITMGETAVLSNDDFGNGNLLVTQQTTLAQPATLESLSFYVTIAVGRLRLGVYDAAGPGGAPGTLQAQTAEFTPIVGWNTLNVVTPIQLNAGTYWLAYLPESNDLHFAMTPSGTAHWYSYPYGPLPSKYSTAPQGGAYHWSFYATLAIGALPPNTPTGTSTATTTALAATATNTPPATATGVPFNTPTSTATPPTVTGSPVYPLKASPNQRYLVDQRGSPFLIQGDSPQGLMALSPADQDTYLSSRHRAGINAIWVSLLCTPYSSICPDVNAYGGIPPFTTADDLATPNEAYFAQVDAMLNRAASYGMVVFLGPIETGYWLPVLQTNGATKDFDYGVYLGNRYKSFPNIIWLSGNDFQTWTNPADTAVVQAVANGIKSVDPAHLQTVELNFDASGSLDDPSWSSIIGLDSAYSYYPQYDQMLREYNRSTVPAWFVEGVYEFQGYSGGYLGPYTLRNQEYWTNLSGSTGQLYGNANLFGFPPGWQTTNWQTTIGFNQAVVANRFFMSYPWHNLIPDQNHTIVTAGYGTYSTCCLNANSDYATTAATADGKLVITYLPTPRTITVDMSKLTGTVTARWFDPTNGVYAPIGTFTNTGTRQFTPALKNSGGDGDWVLILQGG